MGKNKGHNAFYYFMLEVKTKEENRGRRIAGGMQGVSEYAGGLWNKMTPAEKEKYELMSKKGRSNNGGAKFTAQGVPFSVVEEEQRLVRAKAAMHTKMIADMISKAQANGKLNSMPVYFMHANFFCKPSNGEYIPAEIALAKFSFDTGVSKKYHTFVNPESIPLGFAYHAANHAKQTHMLPYPPDAMGERNYNKIANDIMHFLCDDGDCTVAPVFTTDDNKAILLSVMRQLFEASGNDIDCFHVLSYSELFFNMKNIAVTMAANSAIAFPSTYYTEAIIYKDKYDYQAGISCDFHEELDRTKFCALSVVNRWAYTFVDHLAEDLGVTIEQGKHLPSADDMPYHEVTHNTVKMDTLSIKRETDESSVATFDVKSQSESVTSKGRQYARNVAKERPFDDDFNFAEDSDDEVKSRPVYVHPVGLRRGGGAMGASRGRLRK